MGTHAPSGAVASVICDAATTPRPSRAAGDSAVAGFYLSKIVALLVLPPGSAILLILLGLCLLRRFRRFAFSLMAFGLLLLYASSMPLVAKALCRAPMMRKP